MDDLMKRHSVVSRTLAMTLAACFLVAETLAVVHAPELPDPGKAPLSKEEQEKLGAQAAAEVYKQMPVLPDNSPETQYIQKVGTRLFSVIPPQYNWPFRFHVVQQKDINAFALPGGEMFVNVGTITAAQNEAQLVGVMAHEMSHVYMMHSAKQMGKSSALQGLAGLAGAILGGSNSIWAGLAKAGIQIGAGTVMMKYSRTDESQADAVGAIMMYKAGYDPHALADFFKTLAQESGGGGPQFLSDHPNPANRYQAIVNEAKSLRTNGNFSTGQFASIQAKLKQDGRSYTAEEIAQGKARSNPTNGSVGTAGRTATARVEPPSSSMRTYRPTNFMQVSVPDNWAQVNENSSVTYAPRGAYYDTQNGTAFTHGVEFGVAQGGSGNLQRDTESLLNQFSRSNPQLRQQTGFSRVNINGRQGLVTQLSNVSDVSGQQEFVQLTTTYLRNGSMLYMIGVAPQNEANTYNNAFNRVRSTLQIADR